MKADIGFLKLRLLIIWVLVPILLSSQDTLISVSEKYGIFYVPYIGEWSPSSWSNDEFFVFEHKNSGAIVKIKKEQVTIQSSQEFNQQILQYINGLGKNQEFVDLRKQFVPIRVLSQKGTHFLKVKSRQGGASKFVLNPEVDKKLFHIEIMENKSGNEPSEDVIRFVSLISLQPISAVDIASSKTKDKVQPQDQNKHQDEKDDLSSFKKVKTLPVDTKPKEESKVIAVKKEPEKKNDIQSTSVKDVDLFTGFEINKGNIPEVKFEVNDPCKNSSNAAGTPWEGINASNTSAQPNGKDEILVPVIPDINTISSLTYNAGVSSAFEALRLLYGPMQDAEYKKFEALWTPLFDYPDQKVVDYLNQLNPMIVQFLSFRESYVRILSDIQLVLLDASYAVEMNEKTAWETAMTEAKIISLPLKSLEANMRIIATKIEKLGNPPNPNDAKCEARKRYKKMISPEEQDCTNELTGIWIGYSEGYTDLEFYEKQAECMVIFSMPIKIPFSDKLLCTLEGYFIGEERRNQINQKGKYCDCTEPLIFEVGLPEMEEDYLSYLSQDKNKLDFTRNGIHYYYERATNDVLKPGTGLDEKRVTELKPIVETLEKELKTLPVEYIQNADKENSLWEQNAWLAYTTSENYKKKEEQKAGCESAIKRLQYKQKMIPIFQSVAEDWLEDLPLSLTKWRPSVGGDERLNLFTASINQKMYSGYDQIKDTADKKNKENTEPQKTDEELEIQSRNEAIDFHSEMINVIKSNIEKDILERNDIAKMMQQAKTPKEAEAFGKRMKDIELSIIQKESNLQAEQDLLDSQKSGQLVHNRSVFDDFARNQFIENIKENAAKMDATRRIAERIERQIELLPEEIRAKARESVLKNLDAKTVGSGDIEKAKKMTKAINEQIQGYAEYDNAKAKEAEVDAEQNKFYSDMAIMAVGAVATGFASVALAETYGAGTAMTLYGTKALGAIYGGTSGLVAGGPKEGIAQAVGYWSPLGNATVQFIDGYQNTESSDNGDKLWNGIKSAGTGYLMGLAFTLGTKVVANGSLVVFGKESKLFKPLVQSSAERSKNVLDAIRTKQKSLNTADEISTFKKLEAELAILKGKDPILNGPKIQAKESELQKLTAGMNASYDAKWSLKYKADPLTRAKFDRRVQKNYSEMTPEMIKNLESRGYVMKDIEFTQFRNHNSGGSSSMDLDLGPVMRGTKKEPLFIMKKDGTIVSKETFMNDAQKAMNETYFKLFGISAKTSDMNLVSSVHPEAFATARLLDHNINISSFSPTEIASIGRVLEVKMNAINNNKMLTNTNKLQAKCRETSKEIENFLLKKLQNEFDKAPKGSAQQRDAQDKIKFYETILQKFKQIGTEETNAMKILEANRDIMKESGGKDVTGVINDIMKVFGHTPAPK